MKTCLGKRFIFATFSVLCISLVTWRLGYDGEIYLKLIGAVVGVFIIGQTYSDTKKNGKEENNNSGVVSNGQ